jgi:hypothetical protein
MNVDAEMAIYSDAGSNPAISIYNLFKSVDRYLKYQYINTFLFLPADVRRYLIMPSRKSRDFSHGMDRLTQRPFGRFFFWSALYF